MFVADRVVVTPILKFNAKKYYPLAFVSILHCFDSKRSRHLSMPIYRGEKNVSDSILLCDHFLEESQ
jgi:hypothetical protein